MAERSAGLAAEDAIVEQAAELATEVTEADRATDRRRLAASDGRRPSGPWRRQPGPPRMKLQTGREAAR